MPDLIGPLPQGDSLGFHVVLRVIEQAQLNPAPVLGEEREAGPFPIPGGAQRSRPEPDQICLTSAAPRRPRERDQTTSECLKKFGGSGHSEPGPARGSPPQG